MVQRVACEVRRAALVDPSKAHYADFRVVWGDGDDGRGLPREAAAQAPPDSPEAIAERSQKARGELRAALGRSMKAQKRPQEGPTRRKRRAAQRAGGPPSLPGGGREGESAVDLPRTGEEQHGE